MGFGILGLLAFLVFWGILYKTGIRTASITMLLFAAIMTVCICVQKPDMHKPFLINTVEHLIKVNKDGSITETNQVIQTIYEEQVK